MTNYRDLRYVRLSVDDLDSATNFASDVFGLQRADRGDTQAYLRSDMRNYSLCLATEPGQAVALTVATDSDLSLREEKLSRWQPRRLSAAECAMRQIKAGLSVRAPNGVDVELVWRPMTSGWRYHGPRDAGITGFQAVQLACSDIRANEEFWTAGIGAAVSDWAGDAAFLRIDDAHHRIALYPSTNDGILGLTWAVEDINCVMRGWYHFMATQVPIVHGPGRQPTSNAIFVSAKGPAGIIFSYASDTEHGSEIGARGPRQFPDESRSHDIWGSVCKAPEFLGRES